MNKDEVVKQINVLIDKWHEGQLDRHPAETMNEDWEWVDTDDLIFYVGYLLEEVENGPERNTQGY